MTALPITIRNVNPQDFTKSVVLQHNFKVKQLHSTTTQLAEEGDYIVEWVKITNTLSYMRVTEDGIIVVGEELRIAMEAAIKPPVLEWLLDNDLTHKEMSKSLRTTAMPKLHEVYIEQLHGLFRSDKIPSSILNCATHHRYTGLPENLYSNIQVFPSNYEYVLPKRTMYEHGMFLEISWLVFYADGKARFINSKTQNQERLTLRNAVMAYKFINDRRNNERFLDVECWIVPTPIGL